MDRPDTMTPSRTCLLPPSIGGDSSGAFGKKLQKWRAIEWVMSYIVSKPSKFCLRQQTQTSFVSCWVVVTCTMNVQKRNDVSIYCLSAGTTLPEWLGDRARRNLSKTNDSVRRRVELLQDFQMPASSSKLVQSPDGRYIMAAGTYPPRIRCYDVHELGLKFERYVNAAVVDMVMLGDDYGKLALLQDDRTVAFHAHYGAHESIRIPSFGRAMAYEPSTCELLIAAKGNHVYRVNLDEGRFGEPWAFDTTGTGAAGASGTCISVHQRHPLAAIGCDDGTVRFWDNRSPDSLLRPFLKLDVGSAVAGYGYADDPNSSTNNNEITAIAHDTSGLYMAVGTGGGLVALYDVRSSRPLHVQEHKHGLPIHTVKFHSGSGMVLSSDEKLVKIWRYKSASSGVDTKFSNVDPDTTASRISSNNNNDASAIGAVKVNIEGNGKLTHFIVAGDENDPNGERSGLLLCATDQPKMDSFYVPAIGVAPKWCSFLENITEELEERDLKRDGSGTDADDFVRSGQESVFENYKFVSRDDLEKLGISNLVGTPLLRGYMHGFFMDMNLYNRVKAVANPFEYEEYQKKKLKERLDAKQSSRIAPRANDKKKKPKMAVNPDLADRLEQKASDATTKAGQVAKGLLSDDRFGTLFTNPDFQIDMEDEDFKLRNPSGVAASKNKKNNLDSDSDDDDSVQNDAKDVPRSDDGEDDDIAEESDGAPDDHHLDDVNSDSDDDGFQGGKVRGEAYEAMKELERKQKQQRKELKKSKTKKQPIMYEADDDAGESGTAVGLGLGDASAAAKAQSRREEMNMPLAKRRAMQTEELGEKPQIRMQGGSKEVVYMPRDPKRKTAAADKTNRRDSHADGGTGKRNRRGVKELGFKAPVRHQK
jgi:ribosome biogenesis protein ENP2